MRSINAVLLASLAGACTQTLEGAPCPCADGYVCCEAENICLREGASCSVAQAGRGGAEGVAGAGAPAGGGLGGGAGGSAGREGVAGETASGGVDASGGAAAGSAGSAGSAAGSDSGRGGGAGSGVAGVPPVPAAGGVGGDDPHGGGAAGFVDEEPSFVLVATQHNDTSRTGANLKETTLDVSNVEADRFGELSRRALRGATFAQPLVAPGVAFGDGLRRDVLLVATMANVVYALDARQPERPPFWTRDFGAPVPLPTDAELDYGGIWHEVGILGTPVLSPEDSALYLVAATSTDGVPAHTAYKLDLATGAVLKSALIASDGFDAALEAQRAALTLHDGVVYVPFGPYSAGSPASGWVFTFDRELAPLGCVNLGSPTGAGVTMTGDGPAAGRQSSIYFTTGVSGEGDERQAGRYGGRVLELAGAATPDLVERLLPDAVQSGSEELASSGPLLLPGGERLVVVGQHRAYLLDAQARAPSPPLQALRVSGANNCVYVDFACNAAPSSPVFWPGSGAVPAPRVFVWSPNDVLRSFGLTADAASFECDGGDQLCASLASSTPADSYGAFKQMLADTAHLSVSSNGTASGTGIVWALGPYVAEEHQSPDGVLRAFDAERLGMLWSTELAKEPLGAVARGAVPTVSGGQVFVGTADGLAEKTVFLDTPSGGPPAIASYGDDELLVVAWPFATPENQGFQLAWSENGLDFSEYSMLPAEFINYQAALATNGEQVYLAWTTREQQVRVAVSDHPRFVDSALIFDSDDDALFPGGASSGPAIAYGNGRLFLAAHTVRGLELVSSADGIAFDPATHITLEGYVSSSAPLLTYLDGKLYLATADYHGNLDLFVSTDDGVHFDEFSRLPMLTAGHPALVSVDDPERSQVLVWTNAASDGATEGRIMAGTRLGTTGDFTRVHLFGNDAAQRAISAARFRGHTYITWQGTPDAPFPNVARYSTGELVTYGLRK